MKILDCKGLACPAPVLQTKEAIEDGQLGQITVIVDNEASKQNVVRFLESQGFSVLVEAKGEEIHITGSAKGAPASSGTHEDTGEHTDRRKQIMVMITTDRMGFGDDKLGQKLLINFIGTLKEMGEELWRLVFVNNGVKLTVEGSEVLEELHALENMGVSIMVCGTCLTFFNLLEKKQVGDTTNMLDIVTSMQLADQVINI